MARPEEYLEGEFREDQRELQRTLQIVRRVGDMFGKTVIEKEWPYEVVDGKKIQHRDRKYSYSQSTNGMILFALAATARRSASGCPLVSNVACGELAELGDSQGVFQGVWDRLLKETKKRVEETARKHVCWASSFGWDDPFTLTWLLEVDRADVFESQNAQQVRKSLRKRAWDRVRLALEAPEPPDKADRPGSKWLGWEPDGRIPRKKREKLLKTGKSCKDKFSVDHAFPALRYVQLLKSLEHLRKFDGSVKTMWAHGYFKNRVHEQLSQSEIPDGTFDASELVFALEGQLLLAPESVSRALLDSVFHVIGESQNRTAYWRAVKPFVATPQGQVLFPLSVETASSLLRVCSLIEQHHDNPHCFSDNVKLFRRYSEWLRARMKEGTVLSTNRDTVDFIGWHSEHVHLHPGIHLWETSQVMLFLVDYASMLDRHIARRSLAAVHLVETRPWSDDQKTWHVRYWKEEKK
ncbi:MAG: hypothetical protein ACE5JI_00950, partial [Acidobacteriota bacterium]